MRLPVVRSVTLRIVMGGGGERLTPALAAGLNFLTADIRSEKLCFIAVKVFLIMIVHGQLTRICDYVNALRQLWLSSTCGPLCKRNATQEYSSIDHSCYTFLFTLLLFICQTVKHYEEINNCI